MLKSYEPHKDTENALKYANQERLTFDPKLKWQQKLKQKPGVPKNQDYLSEHVFDIPTENFIFDRWTKMSFILDGEKIALSR